MAPKPSIGREIKRRREAAGLSIGELAQRAELSKSYLWELEKQRAEVRPSGRTLHKLSVALGTSMSELMGHKVLVDEPRSVPKSLKRFAERQKLGDRDVQMLAGVNFRGRQPESENDWAFLWDAIRRSVPASGGSGSKRA